MLELPLFAKKIKDNLLYKQRYEVSPTRFLFNCHAKFINDMFDVHQGRCFIVGTGPSLKETNLDLIKNEKVFGVNTLYRNKDFVKHCNYYACSDGDVWVKHKDNILETLQNQKKTPLFLSSDAGRMYAHENSAKYGFVYYVRTKSYINVLGFMPTNPTMYVSGGHSVIADICLPMAWWMGFDEVYLVGCDYSNLGKRWDGLDTENPKAMGMHERDRIFQALELCKKAFEDDDRKIYNATVGGELEVFERKKLEDVI